MTTPHRAHTDLPDALAYQSTRWERYLYDARMKAGGSMKRAVDAFAKEVDTHGGETAQASREDAKTLASEVFARLYDAPSQIEQAVPWAQIAHEALDAISEFEGLRAAVEGDPDFSAIATATLMEALAEKAEQIFEAAEKRENGEEKAGEMGPADYIRAAARRAVAKAQAEVDEGREALASLAPGLERKPPMETQEDPRRMQLAERLRSDARLKEILRRAGRIQRLSAPVRRVRDPHARQEVVDTERGNDLSRALPSGLSRLKHPKLRLLALRDIVERQLLQYRLEGTEKLGRGPVIVLLDESGSMGERSGHPHLWARAIGIATIGIAAREKRPVTVAGFTTSIEHAIRVENGRATLLSNTDPGKPLSEIGGIAEAALAVAGRSTSGGTDFSQPLSWALAAGALDDRADLVIVTDGQASASLAVLAALTEAKTRGCRVYGLTVNGGALTPAVRTICDAAVDLDREKDIDAAIAKAVP